MSDANGSQHPSAYEAAHPDDLARRLRGVGPVGVLAMLVILAGNWIVVPLSAILVLLWAHRSNTPWARIGYVRPRSWFRSIAGGALFGVALKLALKAVVMPILGADPVNHAYHYLAGNREALPGMIFLLIAGAGFGEETMFRGYAFERIATIAETLGATGAGSRPVAVLLTSAWFGVVHYPVQGLAGAEQAAIVGLVLGTIYAVSGRLVPLMCAHAAFDLTALALIYTGREAEVSHLLFR